MLISSNSSAIFAKLLFQKPIRRAPKDLNIHLFVLKMLDDCYKKKDQEAIVAGLGQFDDLVKKKYNKSFSDLGTVDRELVLTTLERNMKPAVIPQKNVKTPVRDSQKSLDATKKKPDVPPLNQFYGAIKQQTIFGYTNSPVFYDQTNCI